jgi:hypothetical protein
MSETEHLLRSPKNAARLRQAIADMNRFWNKTVEEPIPEDMKRLLDRLQ